MPIQKLLPNVSWHKIVPFPQRGGLELANLSHRTLYGQDGFNVAGGVLTVAGRVLGLGHGRKKTIALEPQLLERMFDAP